MLNIKIAPELLSHFKTIFEDEDNENAVLCLKEAKLGCGCKSVTALSIGIDERDDSADGVEVITEGLPFIVSYEVIDSYGTEFEIVADEWGKPRIITQQKPYTGEKGSCSI